MNKKNLKDKQKNNEYNTKKKYGQNFLEDKSLSEKIMEISNVNENDYIIEIGPGLGFLTENLIERSKSVISFEIDNNLIPILNKKFKDKDNFKLVNIDFLEANLDEYLTEKNTKVVANIPYYITSPIINKLLKYKNYISEIYLMVQKEVAERISSRPHSKNMSLLTHSVQFYCDTEYLFTVPKEMFNPIPKVDSAFLKIKVLDEQIYEEQISEEKYFKYLKIAFSNKRKSIANNISSELSLSKEKIGEILEKIGKTKLARTEEFSIQEFINFINELENIKNRIN